jgi:hypothetical protein
LVAAVQELLIENQPLAQAVASVEAAASPVTTSAAASLVAGPKASTKSGRAWTPAKAAALEKLVTIDAQRRVWVGSLEITELIRRRLAGELSSIQAAELSRQPGLAAAGLEGKGGVSSISSPFGGVAKGRSFWFNVNAELIVYGGTEPDAQVTIGGRIIRLRKDGTFSFRFSLPDGNYPLGIAATSADREETRTAQLDFSRKTAFHGEVTAAAQDPALKPPTPNNAV